MFDTKLIADKAYRLEGMRKIWICCSFLWPVWVWRKPLICLWEKDFLIFMGDKMDEKDYDLPKVFAVEKWLFAADTIGCFILTKGSWIGFWGQIIVLFLLFITLIVHTWVFNDERFMSASGIKKKQLKKEAKQAWKNRKKGK